MSRSPGIAITAAVLLSVLLSGCSSGSYTYNAPEPDPVREPVAVDPGGAEARSFQRNSAEVVPAPIVEEVPGAGIAWDDAVNHAGTTQRVCGPLAGGGNSDDDVFLNLGRDYPDPERFQIVVWDVGGLESIGGGVTLCTSGQITLYEGVAQIELTDPNLIEIYN